MRACLAFSVVALIALSGGPSRAANAMSPRAPDRSFGAGSLGLRAAPRDGSPERVRARPPARTTPVRDLRAVTKPASAPFHGEFEESGRFLTIPMHPKPEYAGEHDLATSKWRDPVTKVPTAVRYLRTPAERAPYKLLVKNGLLVDAKGHPFDTRGKSSVPGEEHLAIFVMNAHGEIFASTEQSRGRFQHSTLSGGGPVAAAGMIRVENGKLVSISNESGHYLPDHAQTEQAITSLREQGLGLRGVRVKEFRRGVESVLP